MPLVPEIAPKMSRDDHSSLVLVLQRLFGAAEPFCRVAHALAPISWPTMKACSEQAHQGAFPESSNAKRPSDAAEISIPGAEFDGSPGIGKPHSGIAELVTTPRKSGSNEQCTQH